MKALETALFAATLLLVPALAWLTGRIMGRRNMQIASVVIAGGMVALVPHLARLAALASLDTRPFPEAFQIQLSRTLDSTEVGLFFVAFGVFMTMLSWTATPILTAKH